MQLRTLPALRGPFWLAAGVLLYRRNPPLLSLLVFANLILALFCSQLQPLGPFLLLLASPLFITLIANACAAIERYRPRQMNSQMLTRGLREQAGALLRLGLLQAAGVMLVVLLVDQLLPGIDPAVLAAVREAAEAADAAGGAAGSVARPDITLESGELLKLLLHLGVIALAVIPTFWFAPLLVAWHGVPPLKAVFFSSIAVWRNWRAFLLYAASAGLLVVFLPAVLLSLASLLSTTFGTLLAGLLQLLILLIGAPVLATGTYCSYRDILAGDADAGSDASGSAPAPTSETVRND